MRSPGCVYTEVYPALTVEIISLFVGVAMFQFRIQLFGQFCARRNEQVIAGLEPKVRELLGYLLLHRRHSHSREVLASLLWPDTTTAQSKKKLRQTLWRLQSTLGSQQEPVRNRLLLIEPDQIQINEEADLWLDVAVFEKIFALVERIAGQELAAWQVRALQNAVELYQGPLLEGCYEDWCLYERERLQNRYLVMLEKLMSYCELHRDYDRGILYGMRIMAYDRTRERAHQRLMRLHYLSGDRAAALRQYEQCAVTLDEELGVKPSKRTFELYKQILAEQLVEPELPFTPIETQPTLDSSPSSLAEALDHLTQLQDFLLSLQYQVQQSIRQVEQALNTSSTPSPAKTAEGKDAQETFERRLLDAQRY